MSAFSAAAQDEDGDTIRALREDNEALRQALLTANDTLVKVAQSGASYARAAECLHAENQELLAVLEEAEYALDYASDMTKPEGLSGCDCPICTVSIRIGEALAGKRSKHD